MQPWLQPKTARIQHILVKHLFLFLAIICEQFQISEISQEQNLLHILLERSNKTNGK